MTRGAHGIRRTYQCGCRCRPCAEANRQYSAHYRAARRDGVPVLGARVAGTEAARIVVALLEEGYLKREIATWLGHRWPALHWRIIRQRVAGFETMTTRVTVRTVLKLRALAQDIEDHGRRSA